MSLEAIARLRNLLQVMAFCLVVGTVQYAFQPEKPYWPPTVYSLCIGTTIWAIEDLGRGFFPSSGETGWPKGTQALLLIVLGIGGGYFIGNFAGDLLCRTFSLYTPGVVVNREADLRSSLLITLIAGTVGSYYFYSGAKSEYLERKMGEAREHANEARLKLLETQLEPHMLFNTLANLRALIGVDPARAQSMLDHMIAYLRATLDASRATTHPLQSEFDRLRDYLELMSIRMGPRLRFRLELPPELASEPVPTLLLQPLVENCIKHGLEPKVAGGEVRVSARRDGQDLVLEVSDTGVGPGEGDGGRKGFGLSHVRERLATLHGAAADVTFGPAGTGGSRALLRFPMHA